MSVWFLFQPQVAKVADLEGSTADVGVVLVQPGFPGYEQTVL
jgi:hypothetical protein